MAPPIAGEDYLATSGELVFQPGETSKNIPVTILDDTLVEDDEDFFFILTDATREIRNGDGTAIIHDNDAESLGEIRGMAWHDVNSDGIRDPAEPGLAGVPVYLDHDGGRTTR